MTIVGIVVHFAECLAWEKNDRAVQNYEFHSFVPPVDI